VPLYYVNSFLTGLLEYPSLRLGDDIFRNQSVWFFAFFLENDKMDLCQFF